MPKPKTPLPFPAHDFLTAAEVAGSLNISHATLHRWIASNGFPEPLQLGPRALRWRRGEIIAWIESRPRGTMAGLFVDAPAAVAG